MIADFQKNASGAAFALRRRLQAAMDAYDRLRFTDTAQAVSLEEYAALLEGTVACRDLPSTDQLRRASRLNWESILETLCMILAVILAWRLYAVLWEALSDASALVAFAGWNPLMVLLPFAVFVLPVALVLGSRAGKWLYRHVAYVP